MPEIPDNAPLSIVVVGGSGHLAKSKIYPALFSLYCQNLLPSNIRIFGFARTKFSDAEFRDKVAEHLTCRYTPDHSCADRMNEFLNFCHYVPGQYASADSFLDLYQAMQETESAPEQTNRVFYLAIPPSVFVDTAHAIGNAGLVQCCNSGPWSRVVVEKPFGKDRKSSDSLTEALANVFTEDQTFRIDHYLGKEVVQNLLVLRFANLIFEPIWNRDFVESVHISWKEDLSIEGRGGYFDEYGIIRDVMQNHLLEVLALTAMEQPPELSAESVARFKTDILEAIPPVQLDDIVLGQYIEGEKDGQQIPAYRADSGIPDDSLTPTFAATELAINNGRWRGVPFKMTAGKGLDTRMTEIRIKFKAIEHNIFCETDECPEPNELIIRIQPDEAIDFRITNKIPGVATRFATKDLDLQYSRQFEEIIPDAYESLLLDVIQGDRTHFITKPELQAAWDIFTPLLHEIEEKGVVPLPYPFGTEGPAFH